MNQSSAMTAAISVMYQQLRAQATVLAMKDVYLLTLVAGVAAIFVVVFLIKGAPSKKKVPVTSKSKDGEAAATGGEEEEAELVMVH